MMRWKRNPRPTGLASIGAGPMGSTLRDGEVSYAVTGFISKRHGHKVEGWYWVARNDEVGLPLMNTHDKPVADEATAKANAMAYVRECLKQASKSQASNQKGEADKRTSSEEGAAKPLKRCASGRDGECGHAQCPQLRDNEPAATGRHCPLDND
jgi:hypothetical protein